ncbi:HD-GYP domain-containing protein [Massilia sp. METH4]|uniref:HD-GYP domain-containing protein n=1 Tax=Massilia sp. METH4 TaxID=3123041 RepID=UPI0030CBCBC9
MYIHELSCDWMSHPFMRNRFLLSTEAEVRRVHDAGIRIVVIDTERGIDVEAPTVQQAAAATEAEVQQIAAHAVRPARVAIGEELERAARVRRQAADLVKNVMADARLGKAIEIGPVQPVVQNVTESILRNPGALMGLLRIKSKDDYTFLHSVSVCTLLVAFCHSRGMDDAIVREAGMGALLHDTGKALVPDAILNKPGPLTEAEFAIIRRHPEDGWRILQQAPGISQVALDITRHHHERIDGSGYPDKLAGDDISELAKMAAIVDVYDAITADRCYHKGMPAASALRKLHEWSKFHFDPLLVQAFMRCVGIYPVGTLVLLESGRLGVVVEPHESNLLAPKVNTFFHTKRNVYIRPELVDLSRNLGAGGADRIVSHENPARWNVDPDRFMVPA